MFENAFHLFHISPYKPTSVTSTITALRKGLPISCLDMFQQKFHIPLKTICSLLSYQNSLISSDIKKNRNLPPLISERLLLLTETLLKCSAYFDNEKVFEYWLYTTKKPTTFFILGF